MIAILFGGVAVICLLLVASDENWFGIGNGGIWSVDNSEAEGSGIVAANADDRAAATSLLSYFNSSSTVTTSSDAASSSMATEASASSSQMPTQRLGFDGIYQTIPILVGQKTFTAQIADTDALQQQGLSDRTSLGSNSAMLFVFAQPGRYEFWMKDMQFPLDIIWLDQNGLIVGLEADLSPDTYPKTYTAASDAMYVVELPAGTAASQQIKNGDRIIFDKKLLKKS